MRIRKKVSLTTRCPHELIIAALNPSPGYKMPLFSIKFVEIAPKIRPLYKVWDIELQYLTLRTTTDLSVKMLTIKPNLWMSEWVFG